jgi:hypothetical protein
VVEQVVSDTFEIGRSFLRPAKLHLWAMVSLGQALFESRADLFVREDFSSFDLRETLLDLPQKPIVVRNRPLDRFKRQRFGSNATPIGRAGELGFQICRHLQFHPFQFSGQRHSVNEK